jgi:hypothetical protein
MLRLNLQFVARSYPTDVQSLKKEQTDAKPANIGKKDEQKYQAPSIHGIKHLKFDGLETLTSHIPEKSQAFDIPWLELTQGGSYSSPVSTHDVERVLATAKKQDTDLQAEIDIDPTFHANCENAKYVAGLTKLQDVKKQYNDKRNIRHRRILTYDTLCGLVENIFAHNSEESKEKRASQARQIMKCCTVLKRVKISLLGYSESKAITSVDDEAEQAKLFKEYLPHMFTQSVFLGNEGSGFYAKGPSFHKNFSNFLLRQPRLDHPEDFIWFKGGDVMKTTESSKFPTSKTTAKLESGFKANQLDDYLGLND